MCIGSNSVNQAQDLMFVTKFEDFPNSLIPTLYVSLIQIYFGSILGIILGSLMFTFSKYIWVFNASRAEQWKDFCSALQKRSQSLETYTAGL